MPHTPVPLIWWMAVSAVFLILIVGDLAIFHRKAREITPREAVGWTAFWVSFAFALNFIIWQNFGDDRGMEFLTGYLIEEALSVDNLFVFLVIFSYFSVPKKCYYTVLYWGIIGAIVFRLVFILAGTALINQFHWLIYILGVFLVITAIKLLVSDQKKTNLEKKWIIRVARRSLPFTAEYHDKKFWVRHGRKRIYTPLFLVVLVVEATDVVFALDSIPAIFAITRDPFIVFTSNICAVMGLRSIFFLIEGSIDKFHYLKYGLSTVLAFIGLKMILSEIYHLPIAVSLGVVAALIGASIAASYICPPKAHRK